MFVKNILIFYIFLIQRRPIKKSNTKVHFKLYRDEKDKEMSLTTLGPREQLRLSNFFQPFLVSSDEFEFGSF